MWQTVMGADQKVQGRLGHVKIKEELSKAVGTGVAKA